MSTDTSSNPKHETVEIIVHLPPQVKRSDAVAFIEWAKKMLSPLDEDTAAARYIAALNALFGFDTHA